MLLSICIGGVGLGGAARGEASEGCGLGGRGAGGGSGFKRVKAEKSLTVVITFFI